jgi:hypothetical protein
MGPIRSVAAMPCRYEIGITLVQDDDGWRFQAWHRDDFSQIPLPSLPSEDDRQRCFDTPDAAKHYFKQLAGAMP